MDQKDRQAIVTTGEVIEVDASGEEVSRPLPTTINRDPRHCRCKGFPIDAHHPAWAYYPLDSDGEPSGHHPDCSLYTMPERPIEQSSEDIFDTMGELAIQADKRRESRPKEAGFDRTAHDIETGVRLFWDFFTG